MNAEISPTYIDDVIIPPINEENALPNLREVINTFRIWYRDKS